eukprot:scaffold18060_cov31-Tisochrysis_lutea.AAC.3
MSAVGQSGSDRVARSSKETATRLEPAWARYCGRCNAGHPRAAEFRARGQSHTLGNCGQQRRGTNVHVSTSEPGCIALPDHGAAFRLRDMAPALVTVTATGTADAPTIPKTEL